MNARDTQVLEGTEALDESAGEQPDGVRLSQGEGETVPSGAPPRRRLRRWLVAGAGGAGLCWWVGWHSPLTLVEQVEVVAVEGISADAVRKASGITSADHVPAVDADAVRRSVMSALPAVADVQVNRLLPDTIRLEVTPRTPLAAVQAGDSYYVMDAEGVVFEKMADPRRLPVFRASSAKSRDTARNVFLAIPEDLRAKVVRVSAGSRDDVTLALRNGAVVRWGSVEDSALKARVLAGLMAVKATRYDVSAPLLPTTTGTPVQVESTL